MRLLWGRTERWPVAVLADLLASFLGGSLVAWFVWKGFQLLGGAVYGAH